MIAIDDNRPSPYVSAFGCLSSITLTHSSAPILPNGTLNPQHAQHGHHPSRCRFLPFSFESKSSSCRPSLRQWQRNYAAEVILSPRNPAATRLAPFVCVETRVLKELQAIFASSSSLSQQYYTAVDLEICRPRIIKQARVIQQRSNWCTGSLNPALMAPGQLVAVRQ